MKKAKAPWIWLFVLLILFVLINYFTFSQKPKIYPDFVSSSPSPTGLKAIYTYLNKQLGSTRWGFPPNMLSNEQQKRLLVMVEPSFIPDQLEMKQYQHFMEAGNTILLLQNNPKGMFNVDVTPVNGYISEDRSMKIYDEHHRVFNAIIHSSVRLLTNKGDKVLLYDRYGPVAIKRQIGKGQLLVANTPEWLINDNVLKNDHLTLTLQLMNESNSRYVLFDEYIHGTENAASPLDVYPKWFLMVLFQGIIILALWLWAKGKRFGPIYTPREETVRFGDESIRALSAWYLRGRQYRESLNIQADYVKLLLQEKWGIAYSREWEDIHENLERKWLTIPPGEVPSFINGLLTVLEKENVNKQEYLLWSKKLDRLRKEVEQG